MFLLIRTITYAALFVGFLLVFLPARVLSWSGIARPASIGAMQVAGVAVAASGAVLALWCIVTFVVIGSGTPAPFDPPRLLVVAGPYRLVRNPMYIGAGLALAAAALFYESWALLGYCAVFLFVTHLFVVVLRNRRCGRPLANPMPVTASGSSAGGPDERRSELDNLGCDFDRLPYVLSMTSERERMCASATSVDLPG
jgi:protein-S-isoprenylcysteine O-methyltransferase Ste14